VTIFITFIHVVTCILIIAAVLLQSGKGAETGVMIGGSSQTLLVPGAPLHFWLK
jgi:preprotein translocase subunit SecG